MSFKNEKSSTTHCINSIVWLCSNFRMHNILGVIHFFLASFPCSSWWSHEGKHAPWFVWMFRIWGSTECHLATISSEFSAGVERAAQYRGLVILCNHGLRSSQFLFWLVALTFSPISGSKLRVLELVGFKMVTAKDTAFRIYCTVSSGFSHFPLTKVWSGFYPVGSETRIHYLGICCCR